LGGQLARFAISACRTWQKVLFWCIDHCSLHWVCYRARGWMLQDMDNMKASCVFYVKVGTFTHLEQSKTSLLTIYKLGTVSWTVQRDFSVSVSFIYYSRDSLKQTYADVCC
jgi:hypothetical protein